MRRIHQGLERTTKNTRNSTYELCGVRGRVIPTGASVVTCFGLALVISAVASYFLPNKRSRVRN